MLGGVLNMSDFETVNARLQSTFIAYREDVRKGYRQRALIRLKLIQKMEKQIDDMGKKPIFDSKENSKKFSSLL